jgi:hypothetical protein
MFTDRFTEVYCTGYVYAFDEKRTVRFVAHPFYEISYPYGSFFVLFVLASSGSRFGAEQGTGRCDRLSSCK